MKTLRLIRKYRFEISLSVIAVFAIALLVSGDRVDGTKGWINQILRGVGQFFSRMIEILRLDIGKLTPSDFVALGALLVVGFLILWRIRGRISNAPQFNVKVCPRCGSKLHRAHRKNWDRFLGGVLFLALKRYKCVDKKCAWNGLVTANSRTVELGSIMDEP